MEEEENQIVAGTYDDGLGSAMSETSDWTSSSSDEVL